MSNRQYSQTELHLAILNPLELTQNISLTNLGIEKKIPINEK
jgi:hypothetical protein